MAMRTARRIDISKWQASDQRYPPVIPWDPQMAWEQGVEDVYIKASQTLDDDPEWERNFENAGKRGMRRGLYHFITNQTTGFAQARYFLALTEGKRGELPVAVDVEWPVSAGELWNFCQLIRSTLGYWPVIYVSPGAWNGLVSDMELTPYKPRFYVCPLWQAQWPYANADDGKTVVRLTPLSPWKEHGIEPIAQQFSTLQGWGKLFGSKGGKNIDLDLFDPEWLAQFPLPNGTPPPPPPPEPGPGATIVRAKVNANLRNYPRVSADTKIGVALAGTPWRVEATTTGAGGMKWYRITVSAWIAESTVEEE